VVRPSDVRKRRGSYAMTLIGNRLNRLKKAMAICESTHAHVLVHANQSMNYCVLVALIPVFHVGGFICCAGKEMEVPTIPRESEIIDDFID
jgi:hypothetical protein